MTEVISDSVSERRFSVALISSLAVISLILSAVGIYSVVSYSIANQLKEIGLRIAFGARRRDILRLTIGRTVAWLFFGMILGNVAGFVLSRVLAKAFYDSSAIDPIAFVIATFVLGSICLLASSIPLSRAMSIDPLVLLRYE